MFTKRLLSAAIGLFLIIVGAKLNAFDITVIKQGKKSIWDLDVDFAKRVTIGDLKKKIAGAYGFGSDISKIRGIQQFEIEGIKMEKPLYDASSVVKNDDGLLTFIIE